MAGRQEDVADETNRLDLSLYEDTSSIRQLVQSGKVALIRLDWLVSLEEGALLPRRQDAPPEAFWDVEAYTQALASNQVEHISLSYCWLGREHPDPEGITLKHVKALIEKLGYHKKQRRKYTRDDDFVEYAMFWDFVCLHQKARTHEEMNCFHSALAAMDVLYAHKQTQVWRLTALSDIYHRETLDGDEGDKKKMIEPGYEERGWPFFETCVSELVASSDMVLDLGMLNDDYRRQKLGLVWSEMEQSMMLDQAGQTSQEYPGGNASRDCPTQIYGSEGNWKTVFTSPHAWGPFRYWEQIFAPSAVNRKRSTRGINFGNFSEGIMHKVCGNFSARKVPLTPEAFNSTLGNEDDAETNHIRKRFTNQSDPSIVKDLYKKVFTIAIETVQQLDYSEYAGWDENELQKVFTNILPRATKCQSISLLRNFAPFQTSHVFASVTETRIVDIDLSSCFGLEGDIADLVKHIPNVQKLVLCNAEARYNPRGGAFSSSFINVVGTLEVFQHCSMLTHLNLNGTRISGDLTPLSACKLLQSLDVSSTLVKGNLTPLQHCHELEILKVPPDCTFGATDDGINLTWPRFSRDLTMEPISSLPKLKRVWVSGGEKRFRDSWSSFWEKDA